MYSAHSTLSTHSLWPMWTVSNMNAYTLTNKTKNPYTIPAVKGELQLTPGMIMPGMSGLISQAAHETLYKSSKAYKALNDQRLIVVTKGDKVKTTVVEKEELANTSAPEAPVDITERDVDGAKVESKGVELVEVPDDNDEPARAVTTKVTKR